MFIQDKANQEVNIHKEQMELNPIKNLDLLLDKIGRIIYHKVQKAGVLKQWFLQVLRS